MYAGKGALCALFLFLSSCASQSHGWKKESVHNYTRTILPTTQWHGGMDAILSCDRLFLEVHSIHFPEAQKGAEWTPLLYIIGETEVKTYAHRLKGGQRAEVLPEDRMRILSALVQQQKVEVRIGCYSDTLLPFSRTTKAAVLTP